jgi:hypothetical protein
MSQRLIAITRPEVAATLVANGSTIGSTKLSFVTALGLTAVLAAVPKPRFTLFQRRRSLLDLLEVQRVLEALAASGSVLPACPGTLVDDSSEALELICADASRLRSALEEFGAARQFQIVVTWDGPAMVGAIKRRADVIEAVDAAAVSGRLAAGKALQAIMIGERERLSGEILARLSPAVRDILAMPQDGEDCVANLVVLIDADSDARLDAALVELDALLPGKSRVRCIGPLPAVSFAAVSLDRIDPDRIDAARRLLGVGYRLTAESVRSAWRVYAQAHHPDVAEAFATSTTSAEFGNASAAYRLLRRFADQTERTGCEPALFVDILAQADKARRAA